MVSFLCMNRGQNDSFAPRPCEGSPGVMRVLEYVSFAFGPSVTVDFRKNRTSSTPFATSNERVNDIFSIDGSTFEFCI